MCPTPNRNAAADEVNTLNIMLANYLFHIHQITGEGGPPIMKTMHVFSYFILF